MVINKIFTFPYPDTQEKEVKMKRVILGFIGQNRPIIAGPAKVGYYGNDCKRNKLSVAIPIEARHLPFLVSEKPEGIKYLTPKAFKTFDLRTS